MKRKTKTNFKLISITLILFLITIFLAPVSFGKEIEPRSVEDPNAGIMLIDENANTNEDVMLINEKPIEPREESEEIAKNTTTTDTDVYLYDSNIVINYNVNGNLYLAGSNITIDSNITGNVFVYGNTVTITENSSISGSLFCTSPTLNLKGVVTDLYTVSNNLDISGFIVRDARINSNVINLSGSIGRNVYATSNSINFTNPDSSLNIISGNLNYNSSQDLNIPDENVNGEIKFTPNADTGNAFYSYLMSFTAFVLTTVIIYVACLLLIPNFNEKATLLENNRIFTKLGLGIIAPVAIILLSILFFLLQFTVSISIILICFLVAIFILSSHVSIIILGNTLRQKLKLDTKLYKISFIISSSFVFWLISLIPYLGMATSVFLVLIGLGTIIYIIFSINKKEKVVKNKD